MLPILLWMAQTIPVLFVFELISINRYYFGNHSLHYSIYSSLLLCFVFLSQSLLMFLLSYFHFYRNNVYFRLYHLMPLRKIYHSFLLYFPLVIVPVLFRIFHYSFPHLYNNPSNLLLFLLYSSHDYLPMLHFLLWLSLRRLLRLLFNLLLYLHNILRMTLWLVFLFFLVWLLLYLLSLRFLHYLLLLLLTCNSFLAVSLFDTHIHYC